MVCCLCTSFFLYRQQTGVQSSKLLKFVTFYRDLGVLADSMLHFHGHVHNVVRRAGGLASELLQLLFVAIQFPVSLFVSHIRPFMDFC